MKRFLLSLVLTFFAFSAFAQVPTYRHRLLLPIYLDQPVHGAFNSLWTTQLSMMNTSSDEAYIERCANEVCLTVLTSDEVLRPGETQHVLPEFTPPPSGGPGRVLNFLSFGNDVFDQIAFNLRVADISRSAESAGTEVPVIRERDFRTSTTRLLNVPVNASFRITFRLYSLNTSPADYTIRVFDENAGSLLGTKTVHIVTPTWGIGRSVLDPGYFESDLAALVTAGTTLPAAVRIEVTPLTAGAQFWDFVAITNNSTQEFTLVTPQ